MQRKVIILTALLVSFPVVVMTVILFSPQPANRVTFSHYLKSQTLVREASHAGYSWISSSEFLTFADNGNPLICNVVQQSQRVALDLRAGLEGGGFRSVTKFSIHNDWLLLRSEVEGACNQCLIKLDGSQARTNACVSRYSGVFWMPEALAWMEIPPRSSEHPTIWRGQSMSTESVGVRLNPDLSIGFVQDNVFLCTTNDVQSADGVTAYATTVELQYWHVGKKPALASKKLIEISGEQIASAKASPSGKFLAWLCYSRAKMPQLKFSRGFPFISKTYRYLTKLYVSDPGGENFRFLGALNGAQGLSIEWTPDDKNLSFIDGADLYVVRVE